MYLNCRVGECLGTTIVPGPAKRKSRSTVLINLSTNARSARKFRPNVLSQASADVNKPMNAQH